MKRCHRDVASTERRAAFVFPGSRPAVAQRLLEEWVYSQLIAFLSESNSAKGKMT